MSGLREALRRSGRHGALSDLAVGAMVVSVAIEIAAFAAAAGAGQAATHGSDRSTVVGLDAAANFLDLAIWGPLGVAVLAAALAMLSARLFPTWLCLLGAVSGVGGCVFGVVVEAAFTAGGGLFQAAQAASGLVAITFWLWMLITGVLLFRAAGRTSEDTAAQPVGGAG